MYFSFKTEPSYYYQLEIFHSILSALSFRQGSGYVFVWFLTQGFDFSVLLGPDLTLLSSLPFVPATSWSQLLFLSDCLYLYWANVLTMLASMTDTAQCLNLLLIFRLHQRSCTKASMVCLRSLFWILRTNENIISWSFCIDRHDLCHAWWELQIYKIFSKR